MHFPTVLAATLLSLLGSVRASPLDTRQTTTTTADTVDPPAEYYLQTHVVNGGHRDCGSDKDGLWVYSFHTGAGLGDAALSSNKSWAWPAYLNASQQYFTYADNDIGGWPMVVLGGTYDRFAEVTISIALGAEAYEGFYFNSSGLQYNNSVGGWLACDWWLGTPQLFNINNYDNGPLPNSCSKVQLHPVAV